MKSRLAALLALVSVATAAEQGGEFLELKSPDEVQIAWARRMPDPGMFWKHELDSTQLAVFDQREGSGIEKIRRWSLGARVISKIAWSPDSMFLVMTTESSGGHGPGRYQTFVYCDADGSLRCIGEETGTVGAADFRFEAPDTLALDLLDSEGKVKADETYPTKEVKVVLHEAFSTMGKEEELKAEPAEPEAEEAPEKGDELDPVKAESPDHHWFAATRRIPDDDWIWRSDGDGFRLVIFAHEEDGTLSDGAWAKAEVSLRQVTGLAWSPDSKFIVITTESSGGHSPTYLKSYVFCMADKSLRYIDPDVIDHGIVAPEIDFEAPDIAILQVFDHEDDQQEDDPKTRPVKLPLRGLFEKLPVVWPLIDPVGPPVPEAEDE